MAFIPPEMARSMAEKGAGKAAQEATEKINSFSSAESTSSGSGTGPAASQGRADEAQIHATTAAAEGQATTAVELASADYAALCAPFGVGAPMCVTTAEGAVSACASAYLGEMRAANVDATTAAMSAAPGAANIAAIGYHGLAVILSLGALAASVAAMALGVVVMTGKYKQAMQGGALVAAGAFMAVASAASIAQATASIDISPEDAAAKQGKLTAESIEKIPTIENGAAITKYAGIAAVLATVGSQFLKPKTKECHTDKECKEMNKNVFGYRGGHSAPSCDVLKPFLDADKKDEPRVNG